MPSSTDWEQPGALLPFSYRCNVPFDFAHKNYIKNGDNKSDYETHA